MHDRAVPPQKPVIFDDMVIERDKVLRRDGILTQRDVHAVLVDSVDSCRVRLARIVPEATLMAYCGR